MKKWMVVLAVLMVSLALVLSGCGGSKETKEGTPQTAPKEEKTYNMVLTHEVSTTHWKNALMEKYAKLVEERSNGRIKAKVYPASQLYNDKDAVQALGTGSVQMTWPVSVNVEQVSPAYGIINMPFALTDDLMLKNKQFRVELMELLTSQVESTKMRVMGLLRADATVYVFKDKTPKTPADMKNLKIRVTGGQATLDWLKELGVTAVSMPASEMTTSLAQGVIEGVLTSSDGWATILGPVGKTGLLVQQMQVITYTVLMDAKWFKELPPDLQKVVSDTMDELATGQWQESIDLANKSYKKINSEIKPNLYVVPENELPQWSKQTAPAMVRFSQKYADVYQKFVALEKKYGKTWPMQ